MDTPFYDTSDIHSFYVYCVQTILSLRQIVWTVKLFADSVAVVNLRMQCNPDSRKIMDGRSDFSSGSHLTTCVRFQKENSVITQLSKLSLCLRTDNRSTKAASSMNNGCYGLEFFGGTALLSYSWASASASLVPYHSSTCGMFFGGLVRCLHTELLLDYLHYQQQSLLGSRCKAYPYATFMMACYKQLGCFKCEQSAEQDLCCICLYSQCDLGCVDLSSTVAIDCACSKQASTDNSEQLSEDTRLCAESESKDETQSDNYIYSQSRLDACLPEGQANMSHAIENHFICTDFKVMDESIDSFAEHSVLYGMNGSEDSEASYVEMSAEAKCSKDMVDEFVNTESSIALCDAHVLNNFICADEIIFEDTSYEEVHESGEESEDEADWSDDGEDDEGDSYSEIDSSGDEFMTCGKNKHTCTSSRTKIQSEGSSKTASSVCSAFFTKGSFSDSEESASSSEEEKDSALCNYCERDEDEEENWSSDQDQDDFSCLADLDPFQVSGLYIPPASTSLVTRPELCSTTKTNKSDESHGTDGKSSIKRIYEKWNLAYGGSKQVPVIVAKKVSFDEKAPALIAVLNEEQWAEDYRNARMSSWEELARDRDRFRRRIMETAGKIEWVLKPEHRARYISTI